MIKKTLLILAIGIVLFGAPTIDTITDTIYDQTGSVYNGQVVISLSTPSGISGGNPVLSVVKTLTIKSGALSAQLVANDSITPAGTSYQFSFGQNASEYCTFPTSVSPLKLGPYCTTSPPNPPILALSATAPVVYTPATATISLSYTPENVTNKGAASGYAPLNSSSQVPIANLPTTLTGAGSLIPQLDSSGNLFVSGGYKTGAGPSGGWHQFLLGNSPGAPCIASGFACLYGDASSGRMLASYGGGTAYALTRTTSWATGKIPVFNGQDVAGGSFQDATNILESVTDTQTLTYQGGQDSTGSYALGNTIVRGANATGSGSSQAPGGVLVQSGAESGGNGNGNASSAVEIVGGNGNGGFGTVSFIPPGPVMVGQIFGASLGSPPTASKLVCAATVGVETCGTSPSAGTVIGVAISSFSVLVSSFSKVAVFGSQVPVISTGATTPGDAACASTSTAGEIFDNGNTSPTCNGTFIVGVIVSNTGIIDYPDGTSFTLSSTLPLVQLGVIH